MDAAAEFGREPVRKHQIQPEFGDEQTRLTRDGTAEPVPRDQILRIGNLTRLIHTLAICDDHTYILTPRSTYEVFITGM